MGVRVVASTSQNELGREEGEQGEAHSSSAATQEFTLACRGKGDVSHINGRLR